MNIYLILGLIPYAAALYPIHEYFQNKRMFKTSFWIWFAMCILVIIQLGFALIYLATRYNWIAYVN